MSGKKRVVQSLDQLPEELLEHIVSFLDICPPSQSLNPSEPSLDGLFTNTRPLKALSLASKSWRYRVAPSLFRYLRVPLEKLDAFAQCDFRPADDHVQRPSVGCALQCRRWQDGRDHPFLDACFEGCNLSKIVTLRKPNGQTVELPWSRLSDQDIEYVHLIMEHIAPEPVVNTRPHLSHDDVAIGRILDYLERHRLKLKPLSLLVHTSRRQPQLWDRATDIVSSGRSHLTWRSVFKQISPDRLVLVAPPSMIAWMTSCYSDTTDEWAFSIPYQRLELRIATDKCHAGVHSLPPSKVQVPPRSATKAELYEASREREYKHMTQRMRGVLYERFWDSMEYDEGSSLNAYGTYHYFEKVSEKYCRPHFIL